MIVGIDVDGVLADFITAYERLFVEVSGVNLFPLNTPPPVWDWPQHYGYTTEHLKAVWTKIKESHTFWGDLAFNPDAAEFLEDLSMTAHEVYFITDRPGIETQAQTQLWLDFYFPMPSVIISRRGKGAVCKALSIEAYIDDKAENVEDVWAVSPETKTYLLRCPYNSRLHGCEGSVGSLEEFAEKAKLWE